MYILLFIAASLMVLNGCDAGKPDFSELDSVIPQHMRDFNVKGAAVAVVKDGEIVYLNGFGLRDDSHPVNIDTRFMIGSITKSMTVHTLAALVDEGALAWDTPVVELLPDFALSDPDLTQRVRVRDLVSENLGVQRADLLLLLDTLTPQELVASLRDIPINPDFAYNNQVFAAAGLLTGQPYPDLVQSRLFDPLGMTRSTFDFDTVRADGNHAEFHDVEKFALSVLPAGGAWSTIHDMARYMQFVMAQNRTEFQTPYARFAENVDYGMGWMISVYRGHRLIFHSGNTFGFTSDFAFLPDSRLGVVVLTNNAYANAFTQALREWVFETALHLPHTAYTLYLQGNADIQPQLNPPTSPVLTPYQGEYEHGVSFTVRDGTQILQTEVAVIPLLELEDGRLISSPEVMVGLIVEFRGNHVTLSLLYDPSQRVTLKRRG